MRVLLITVVFMLLFNAVNAQQKTLEKLKKEVEIEGQHFRDSLVTHTKHEITDDKIINRRIDHQVAMYKISLLEKKRLAQDYTTLAMVEAVMYSESQYDSLLNVYYNMLMDRLSEPDKEVLRTAQRNWLKFRDAEKQLIFTVAKDEYSGGGTMQRNINASFITYLTQQRMLDLYDHLDRFFE